MPRYWYGIEYAYGAHVVNNGNRADRIARFLTRAERDQWVSRGEPDTRTSGYRSALAANSPLMRAVLRRYDTDWESVGRYEYAL